MIYIVKYSEDVIIVIMQYSVMHFSRWGRGEFYSIYLKFYFAESVKVF